MTFMRNDILVGEAKARLVEVASESVDLVVTDPPYLVNYRDKTGRRVANDANADGVLPVFDQIYRVMKRDTICICFCGWTALPQFTATWAATGFNIAGHIVWTKDYASSKGHTAYHHESAYVLTKGRPPKPKNPISDIQQWRYSGNRSHPTEKAVDILTPLIRAFSNAGDLVLDPFSGSGSTAVAASLTGRDYLGVELEQRYVDLAKRRLLGVARYDQSAKAAA